jgi:hypothetical protein
MTNSLEQQWIAAKQSEDTARLKRLEIESALIKEHHIEASKEGRYDLAPGLTVECKINRKVDGDKLQQVAAENGLSDQLAKLFRWKPDIDARAWKAAHKDITEPLSAAIESKPAKPSFSYKAPK